MGDDGALGVFVILFILAVIGQVSDRVDVLEGGDLNDMYTTELVNCVSCELWNGTRVEVGCMDENRVLLPEGLPINTTCLVETRHIITGKIPSTGNTTKR